MTDLWQGPTEITVKTKYRDMYHPNLGAEGLQDKQEVITADDLKVTGQADFSVSGLALVEGEWVPVHLSQNGNWVWEKLILV